MSYLRYLCSSLPPLFVGGLMSYLRYLCFVFTSFVCRRVNVLLTLFVFRLYLLCL